MTLYWVGQKVYSGFSIRYYRKPKQTFGQPNVSVGVQRKGEENKHPGGKKKRERERDGNKKGTRMDICILKRDILNVCQWRIQRWIIKFQQALGLLC